MRRSKPYIDSMPVELTPPEHRAETDETKPEEEKCPGYLSKSPDGKCSTNEHSRCMYCGRKFNWETGSYEGSSPF
jgi:hypothetical protein